MSTRPKDQTRIRATSFADQNAASRESKPSSLGGVRVSRKYLCVCMHNTVHRLEVMLAWCTSVLGTTYNETF